MDYDVGIVRRRRIISPDECYFAVPPAGAAPTTWDPVNNLGSGIVLSGGNLVASNPSTLTNAFVQSTTSYRTGKKYAEITYAGTFGGNNWFGALSRSDAAQNVVPTKNTGQYNINSVLTGACGVPVSGDTVGIAADFDNSLIWTIATTQDLWNGSAIPSGGPNTGASGVSFAPAVDGIHAFFLLIIFMDNTGQSATVNFTGPFTFGLPTGFGLW